MFSCFALQEFYRIKFALVHFSFKTHEATVGFQSDFLHILVMNRYKETHIVENEVMLVTMFS